MARAPQLPDLQEVPAGPLEWLRDWLGRVLSWVRHRDPEVSSGDPADKFTTRSELARLGVLRRGLDGTFVAGEGFGSQQTIIIPGVSGGGGGGTTPDLTPPPTATGLTVTPGITFLIIGWDAPVYTQGHGHAQTIIYGAIWLDGDPEPTFGDPRTKQISTAEGAITVHAYPTNPATRWCIWIKWKSVDGVESASPTGGAHGVQATTGQDVSALLEVLTNQITASQLFYDLAIPINSLAGDLEAGAMAALSNAVAVHRANQQRASDLLAEANDRGTALTEVRSVVNQGDAQLAQQILTLTAKVDSGDAVALAGIEAANVARANGDSAEALQRNLLAAQLRGAYTGADLAELTEGLLYQERQVRAGQTDALASSIEGLEVTVDGVSAALIEEASVRATQTGDLFGKLSVKIDLGGFMTGWGLASTVNDGVPSSDFYVRADRIGFVPSINFSQESAPVATALNQRWYKPSTKEFKRWDGAAWAPFRALPLTILTSPTTEGGEPMEAGVYIEAANILNLTAAYARIASLVADQIVTAELSAAQLTLGDGTVGGNLRSANYVAGVSGWILRPNGTTQLPAADILGQLTTSQLLVGSTHVAADGVVNVSGALFGPNTTLSIGPSLIESFTSIGSPVTTKMQASVGIVSNTAGLAFVDCRVWITVDGTRKIDTEARMTLPVYPIPGSSNKGARFVYPLFLRETPAAGSHDYQVEVECNFYDASGNSLGTTGTYGYKAYVIVTENKV